MLETLLLVSCLGGTSNSCMTTGEAYTKYSGIQRMVDQYGSEHPITAHVIGTIGLMKERRLYYKISGPWHHDIKADGNTVAQLVWYKKEW